MEMLEKMKKQEEDKRMEMLEKMKKQEEDKRMKILNRELPQKCAGCSFLQIINPYTGKVYCPYMLKKCAIKE